MSVFDFISGDDFRSSLEADYQELQSALQVKAWKAVHVLSGSIVETLLVDYLVAIDYQKKRPLELDLGGAIFACKEVGVLSERTEHLTHVIRSYRNLIHPGRVIRLGEVVDENSARIAYALVGIIIDEISVRKREKFGYTAEQITTKIVRDSSSSTILGHILKNVNEFELERLLLNIIPQKYFELMESDEPVNSALTSLSICFRLAINQTSIKIQEKIAKNFVRILKEESQDVVYAYETSFFRGSDLPFYSLEDAQLVKQHLLSRLTKDPSGSLLNAMEGIGPFLTLEDIDEIIDPIARILIDKRHNWRTEIRNFITEELSLTNREVDKAISKRLKEWSESLKKQELVGDVNLIDEILERIVFINEL